MSVEPSSVHHVPFQAISSHDEKDCPVLVLDGSLSVTFAVTLYTSPVLTDAVVGKSAATAIVPRNTSAHARLVHCTPDSSGFTCRNPFAFQTRDGSSFDVLAMFVLVSYFFLSVRSALSFARKSPTLLCQAHVRLRKFERVRISAFPPRSCLLARRFQSSWR